MRALLLRGVREVAVAEMTDPVPTAPDDAVVRVLAAGLCGSDLHPYEGREPVRFPVVPGHEAVGEVVAAGPDVRTVAVGDRVIVPFTTSCGRCAPCSRGLTARCESGRLLGWADPDDPDAPPVQGAQAELLRVPLADGTLVRLPGGLDPHDAVLLSDNLPTAWYAVERADVTPGASVAVVGCGAVGLCAIVAARAQGAARVFAVDPVASRRAAAERLGAEPLAPEAVPDDLRVDAVVEAAGPVAAQAAAAGLVRTGGTLSIIAVQTAAAFGVSPVLAYDRNLTLRAGRAPVRSVLDRLLPRVASGEVTLPSDVVLTHRALPLDDGPDTYRRFAAREDGLVKATFAP